MTHDCRFSIRSSPVALLRTDINTINTCELRDSNKFVYFQSNTTMLFDVILTVHRR